MSTEQWYYCLVHHDVEPAEGCKAIERLGPYPTREEAAQALRLAQERERLTVIDDQWGTPTGADLLADVTAHALRHLQQRPQDAGLYHCAAAGATNWNEYAKFVIAQAQLAQAAIKIKARHPPRVACFFVGGTLPG